MVLSLSGRLSQAAFWSVMLGAALWCTALALPPLTVSNKALTTASETLYHFFHRVCHQFPDHSFYVLGQPLAVCARCAAIYFAFLVGSLLYPLLRRIEQPVFPPRWLLTFAGLPMLFDVLAGPLGIYSVTNITRLTTGTMLGLALPFFIIPAAIKAVNHRGMLPRSLGDSPQPGGDNG